MSRKRQTQHTFKKKNTHTRGSTISLVQRLGVKSSFHERSGKRRQNLSQIHKPYVKYSRQFGLQLNNVSGHDGWSWWKMSCKVSEAFLILI